VWSGPIPVTVTPSPNHPPLSTVDHQGRLHLIWDTLATPRFLYHTYLSAQGWVSPTAVAQTLGISEVQFPPLVDGNGTIHLAWRSDLGTGVTDRYRILYAQYDGGQWSPEEEVFHDPYSLQALLHSGAQGGIRIGAVVSTGYFGFSSDLYDFQRTGLSWTSFGPFVPAQPATWIWPDMTGGIRTYGDSGQNSIKFSLWHDGQVVTNGQTANGGLVSNRQTQLDGQSNLHVFWTGQVPVPGGVVTGMFHQCLSSQLNWGQATILSGSDNVAGLAGKASDYVSRVVLAYKVASTGEILLKLFDECNLIATATVPAPEHMELSGMALSNTPFRFCVLLRKLFTSNTFASICSEIMY
jgi:hypothetical protein